MSGDHAGSYEYIRHAIGYYEAQGQFYDALVLLQPTSPLRTASQLKEMLSAFTLEMDMMVSVRQAQDNPICVSFVEDDNGHLQRLFKEESTLRQEVPDVYEYNGAFYIMNIASLKKGSYNDFSDISKYIMDERSSVDIDTLLDWDFVEFLLNRKK